MSGFWTRMCTPTPVAPMTTRNRYHDYSATRHGYRCPKGNGGSTGIVSIEIYELPEQLAPARNSD